MIADVFNKEVALSGVADASAIGAAIMGFLAMGLVDDLDAAKELIHVVRTYEPDAARHAIYQGNYRIFAQLYGRLYDLMR
jgi:gluconokinase